MYNKGMQSLSQIAIILVDYNGEKDTRECLLSLKEIRSTSFAFSVVVVDNGSKEILTIPPEKMPKETAIVRSDANLGFTNGNNLGITYALEHSSPDYIVLLNNDTTVDAHFLEEMLKCAQKNEHVGMVTPKIFFSAGREYHKESYKEEERGKVLWYAGGSIDWRNLDAFHRGVDEVDRGQFDTQTESDFATGCCVLIPRPVLEKIGRFNQKYFLYLEDVDLSMRVREIGERVLFCPTAKVWHKNAGSSGGAGSVLHQYYQTRNRLFFFFTYGQLRTRWVTIKYGLKLFLHGNTFERLATIDWLVGRMGKQAVL